MRALAFWSSLIFIFIIPYEKVILLDGFGTFGRAYGLVAGMIWVITILIEGRIRRLHFFHIIVGLYFLWCAMSILWSQDISLTLVRISNLSQMAILMLMYWDLYTAPEDLEVGMQAYVLGASVIVVRILYTYVTGSTEHLYGMNRYTVDNYNANAAGSMMAYGLPFACYFALTKAKLVKLQALKWVNYTYIPSAILAIVLTASRSVTLSMIPCFFYIVGSLNRLKPSQRIAIMVILIGTLSALPVLVPETAFQRIGSTVEQVSSGNLNNRGEIWTHGWTTFVKFPLIGVGTGAFKTASGADIAAHNAFFQPLVEVGLIGFILFSTMLGTVVTQAASQPKEQRWLWFTLLAVWAIVALAMSVERRKVTWLFFTFVLIAKNVSVPWRESKPSTKPSTVPSIGLPNPRDG